MRGKSNSQLSKNLPSLTSKWVETRAEAGSGMERLTVQKEKTQIVMHSFQMNHSFESILFNESFEPIRKARRTEMWESEKKFNLIRLFQAVKKTCVAKHLI